MTCCCFWFSQPARETTSFRPGDTNRFFGYYAITAEAKVVQRSRFNFFREAQIWYNSGNEDRLLGEPYENVIVLSNEFLEEVTAHPIPSRSRGGETSFIHACCPRFVRVVVPPMLYLERDGTDTNLRAIWTCAATRGRRIRRPRKFREKLHQWLKTIRLVWPRVPCRDHPRRRKPED
jgi:hypothetical protein